ncbi:DUF1826 domain-containing protein [Neptuniibacter sp.]|uniref:DUF1826 domain-containing protein n=1 Tax=Neptuniibacter sp. TaxID=1962643 RepID=UPI00262CD912|nr:DUF1826 domain-containing protein [Neptuniibacter sp.]MCP4598489.1 DUF1826 domain-containing protein [Neptuniibacter sp.]
MGAAELIKTNVDVRDDQGLVNSSVNHVTGHSPEVLTAIYQEQINLVVMQRSLSAEVRRYCQEFVESKPNFNLRSVINPEFSKQALVDQLPDLEGRSAFTEDLAYLLEMYACLFDLDEVGLRLQVLDRAMCPRFHTDKLGCRLVTTYIGQGTEWLNNTDLDRTKLGAGNMGLSDEESGLYSSAANVQQVDQGDIVLLKGDGWYGNEGLGAVHRSPAVALGDKRVVVTMDFA